MNGPFKVSDLTFKQDLYTKDSHIKISLENITILVGPNSSGKSQILRDLDNFFTTKSNVKLLNNISFDFPLSETEIDSMINEFRKESPDPTADPDEVVISAPDLKNDGRPLQFTIKRTYTKKVLQNISFDSVLPAITRLFTVRLDGRTRFNLLNSKQIGNLTHPENFFASLFTKNTEREKIRNIIKNEFGLYCYIEATSGTLNIKMSPDEISSEKETSLSKEAVDFFHKAIPITEFGDGTQAFVGLLLAVASLPHKIMLIDEPEAFLHPPQANHLGKYLTQFAEERKGSLIASTHSADFLMGCLESSTHVKIIRLSYDRKIGTVKELDVSDVLKIMRDPLLRSTDTLNALFHKSAIITESDGDRVFYNEINRKLQSIEKNIDDVVFLNSHGKDDMHRIAGALRKIGIPSACIYDLDIVKIQSNQWRERLKILNVPNSEIEHFEEERRFLLTELQKIKKDGQPDPFTRQGLPFLDDISCERSYKFVSELAKFGIFVIDIGELEQWLKTLNVGAGDKMKWVANILNKLDSINADADKDVWKFIIEIGKWISNPNRFGM
ncbi:MAG: ATP-binding protein [Candidatus Nitrosotenuis sp.]|nr:MAG: ATP-binding protein [Candidatus Nitrosotenuis sp.]